MKYLFSLSILFILFSCKQNNEPTISNIEEEKLEVIPTKKKSAFTKQIEDAHKKDAFLAKKAITFNIDIQFGGATHLKGIITQLTDGSKIRIDKTDGSKIIYDNTQVFLCPNDASNKGARFDIFTWSYFFSLPYKLNDPGTIWQSPSNKKWGETNLNTEKLSFKDGTGDAPKDWYIIYKENETSILSGAAYIVSFGKDMNEAEKEPHAIKYNDYKIIEGIPFATNWTFHMWNDKDGYTDQIGNVTLTNIQFINPSNDLFTRPEDSKTIKL